MKNHGSLRSRVGPWIRWILIVLIILVTAYLVVGPALATLDISDTSDAELLLTFVVGIMATAFPLFLLSALLWEGRFFPVLMVLLSVGIGDLAFAFLLPATCEEAGTGCWSVFGNEVQDDVVSAALVGGAMAIVVWTLLAVGTSWWKKRRRFVGS